MLNFTRIGSATPTNRQGLIHADHVPGSFDCEWDINIVLVN